MTYNLGKSKKEMMGNDSAIIAIGHKPMMDKEESYDENEMMYPRAHIYDFPKDIKGLNVGDEVMIKAKICKKTESEDGIESVDFDLLQIESNKSMKKMKYANKTDGDMEDIEKGMEEAEEMEEKE